MPDTYDDLGWAWLTVATGVVLALVSLQYVALVWRRRRTWVITEATVGKVRVREASASGTDGGIFANYHFTDRNGQQHMGVHEPLFRKPKRKSVLRIRYDPETPDLNEVVTPLWADMAIAAGGIAGGVALTLFSLRGGFGG